MPRLRRSRTRFCHRKSGRKQSRGGRESSTTKCESPDSMGYNLDAVEDPPVEISEATVSCKLSEHDYSLCPGPSTSKAQEDVPVHETQEQGVQDVPVHETQEQGVQDVLVKEAHGQDVEEPPVRDAHGEDVTTECAPPEDYEEKLLDLSISGAAKPATSLSQAHKMIRMNIPKTWKCWPSNKGLTLAMFSENKPALAVQRQITIGHDGTVKIAVHRRPLQDELRDRIVSAVPAQVSFTDSTWVEFARRAILLTRVVDSYAICCGADNEKYKDLWKPSESAYIDVNPYGEPKYNQSLRSQSCTLLVQCNKWRCYHCLKIQESLKKKRSSHQGSEYNPNTANIHLDEAQMMAKLKDQRDELKAKQREINRLQRANESLKEGGVSVDKEMNKFLAETFTTAKPTPGSLFEKFQPLQKLFLSEQIKNTNVKGASGVKWHPAIIRLALLIRSQSKSAYDALRGSGAIKLPSDRTLFEYSHISDAQEGCKIETMNKIAEKLKNCKHEYQTYHDLIFDEMHVSKNLVYCKTTGNLIGYVNLSNVEQELRDLERFIDSDGGPVNESEASPAVATQMLTFMIKGTANDVKETVATYTTNKLVAVDLYSRFWDVMIALEKRKIRVVAAACDGSGVNRSFINMHVPLTKVPSGVIFDTVNLCSDGRPLYFFSDVPHLIKTARNCFFNSGFGSGASRLLTINGQHIIWQTIRRMFLGESEKNWRRCRKLNGQNINLNSYSIMKVSYAAQVLSNTVATDLELMEWEGTEETVKFIRLFNDFFDMLNGAYAEHHIHSRNANLAPYRTIDDPRYEKLLDFLKYLDDWKIQVDSQEGFSQSEKNKMLLSRETLKGIEISIRSFIGATKFLLSEGTKFINARIFCQDPLEQYHSKQRANVGGSTNPNVQQFLHSDNKIELLRDVSDVTIRHRKGNVKAPDEDVQISSEPLAKRKKK